MTNHPAAQNRALLSQRFLLGALAAALLVVGCATEASPPQHRTGFPESSGSDEVMRDEVFAQSGRGLTVDLSAESEIMFGGRDPVVHVAITNNTSEEVSAEELAPELRIDGGRVLQLDLAAQGVGRIAPGQTAEFDQPLGVRLLTPGDHTLQLDIGESHSLPIHILVRE